MSFARLCLLIAITCITLSRVYGQAVVVTTRLDTNRIVVGGSTTLHVYAQVVPALRASADQIFSWYLDVLNTNGAVANANYDAMVKPSSDNDPEISSRGVTAGANRNDIYDTFLNLSNAGVAVPVELMSIPVTGTSEGHTRFQIRAGDALPLNDFLVSLAGGTDIASGGDYSSAFSDLDVVPGGCSILLHIAPAGVSGAPGQRLALTFIP